MWPKYYKHYYYRLCDFQSKVFFLQNLNKTKHNILLINVVALFLQHQEFNVAQNSF